MDEGGNAPGDGAQVPMLVAVVVCSVELRQLGEHAADAGGVGRDAEGLRLGMVGGGPPIPYATEIGAGGKLDVDD